MSRTLKFRAWDKEKKAMNFSFLLFPKREGGEYSIPGEGLRFEIMQYTGLKDKNGKEIYEGDIVRVLGKFIDEVVWASGCFCMKNQIQNYEFTWQDESKIEVIGNIYENPDLLDK